MGIRFQACEGTHVSRPRIQTRGNNETSLDLVFQSANAGTRGIGLRVRQMKRLHIWIRTLNTRGYLALLLYGVAPAAHASGSPVVMYLLACKVLMLLCIAIWAAVIKRPYCKKIQAFSFVIFGLLGIGGLTAAPDYMEHQVLIEGASILTLSLVFVGAYYVLRQR